MRFNVLGPIEVVHDGTLCTPTAPKVRWTLALLLLRDNQIVHTSSLVDELWGDTPPRSAVATTQTYIYQLRKCFKQVLGAEGADEILLTRPPGYGLRLTDEQSDAQIFSRLAHEGEALLADGKPAEASDRLRAALELWRGPACADLEPGRILEAHIAHLNEMRMRVLELRISADVSLGRHRELIPELRTLVAEHPLNEWFHEKLIDALNLAGRRGEALQAYRALLRILDEELGLEPSLPVRRLHQDLLTGRERASHLPVPAIA